MTRTRREAYGAGVLTLATFMIAPLMAPGPLELANIAGLAVAFWAAIVVWRRYGSDDAAETFIYRVAPAGPSLLFAAMALFLITLTAGWIGWIGFTSPRIQTLDAFMQSWWTFPLSPLSLYVSAAPDAPPLSLSDVRIVGGALSGAAIIGAVLGLICLFGSIPRKETLRSHAVIWRGWRLESAESRLAARGVKGLQPVRDPIAEAASTRPLSKWAFLRAASLSIAVICLPYAPVCLKLLTTMDVPEVQAFFANPVFSNAFVMIWLTGLWGFFIAASVILVGVYLRLGFALARS